MTIRNKITQILPAKTPTAPDMITDLCREGAKKMLQMAIEQEIAEYIERHQDVVDECGHRLVVRNGHMPERQILTGIGEITIKQPRINDRRFDDSGQRQRFQSSILPPYLRRTKNIDELIPWLYLKGISTGDFTDALAAILGPDAPGLSATNVTRLKAGWIEEYKAWSKRSLKGKRFIYFWADGIYSRVRLGDDDDRQCLLVIMGATENGFKEMVAIEAGVRESELSWKEVLLDLRRRGLEAGPELAIGDGALGFWAALGKVFPKTRWQRCWVHKMANVLDKLPKTLHGKAKGLLHEIWMASTRKEADKAFDHFMSVYEAKYPKATECLNKDRDDLLAFYDFPAEQWKHIRTTNPIESTFATIRLRTKRTKGHGSAEAALAMMFKLSECAAKRWRKLDGSELLADVISLNVKFIDGIRKAA